MYQEYLDLAVIFAVQIRQTEEMNASVTVNERLAGMWKVGNRELWEAASENLEREAFTIETIESVLEEALGECCLGKSSQDEDQIYVMTNRNRCYGARAVLRKDIVKKLADRQKCNLYLLPSSVHEWILCKDDGEIDARTMKQMVCEINGDSHVISPEECLSDSIYYYDKEQDTVEIVA